MTEVDFVSRLEPQLARIFDTFAPLDLSDIPAAREEITRRLAGLEAPRHPAVERSNLTIPGAAGAPEVLLRVYRPVGQSHALPCLVWIHGGGYVMGTIDRDDAMMDHIVATVGCVAVSVEWRQAPEHPFPASHDDCHVAVLWVAEHAPELLVDPNRISLGGASSGGGSAAGVALRLRDEDAVRLAQLLLVYPMIDDRNETASSRLITDPRVWNRDANVAAWRAYLGESAGSEDVSPYAAPARAEDLSGLPPTFIAVGDLDLFLDEDLDFARRLISSGVSTEVHVYPGAIHGFYSFAPDSPNARRFADDRDLALLRTLFPGEFDEVAR